jgi:S-phase kinase-associated protein 1
MEGEGKLVTLETQDGVVAVDVRLLGIADLVASALPDDPDEMTDDFVVPIPNVKSSVMEKVVDFLKLYAQEPMNAIETPMTKVALDEVVQAPYAQYIDQLGCKGVFEVIAAANYLGVAPLVSLALAWVAFVLKGPSLDDFKKLYTIHNKFTAEEEAIFREEVLLRRRCPQNPNA